MPCAANYKLVACALSFANGTAVKGADGKGSCSETPLGSNGTAWKNQPWANLPSLGLLKDRQNYTVGSTATLAWMNAYWRPATGARRMDDLFATCESILAAALQPHSPLAQSFWGEHIT